MKEVKFISCLLDLTMRGAQHELVSASLLFHTTNWLILSHSGDGQQVVYEGNKVVVEGDPFTITCHLTVYDVIKWQLNEQTINPDSENQYKLEEEKINGKVVAKLSVLQAQHSHTGSYRCTSFSNVTHQVYVLSGKVDISSWHPICLVLLLFPLELLISCKVLTN